MGRCGAGPPESEFLSLVGVGFEQRTGIISILQKQDMSVVLNSSQEDYILTLFMIEVRGQRIEAQLAISDYTSGRRHISFIAYDSQVHHRGRVPQLGLISRATLK